MKNELQELKNEKKKLKTTKNLDQNIVTFFVHKKNFVNKFLGQFLTPPNPAPILPEITTANEKFLNF